MRIITQSILFLLSACYLILGMWFTSPEYHTLQLLGSLGIFQFALSAYSWIKLGGKIISPYILFLVCLYIFSCGQLLLYPFDIKTARDLIWFMGIKLDKIYLASLYTLVSLAFFHIGALCYKNSSHELKPNNPIVFKNQNRRLKQIGWLLTIIAVYPYFTELIDNVILSRTRGYSAIYKQEARIGLSNIFRVIGDYFIPGLICLYIAYRKSTRAKTILYTIFSLIILLILAVGGRTEAVILLSLVLIIQNYFIKPFNKKQLIILGIGAIFVLQVLTIVGKTRRDATVKIEAYTSQERSNAATEAIGEMGWTMFCIAKTEQIVPEKEDFRYGKTYAYSFLSIIPNLNFWEIHPAKTEAEMSEWLTKTLHMNYGSGFSMVAESYVNFGYFGPFVMLLLGYLTALIFRQLKPAISANNLAYSVFIIIMYWFALKIPRNSFIGIVRAFFYFALPIFWYTRGYIIKQKK